MFIMSTFFMPNNQRLPDICYFYDINRKKWNTQK
jgi:hypothetical protein